MFNSIQFNFIIEARNNQFQALTDKTIQGRREGKKTHKPKIDTSRKSEKKRPSSELKCQKHTYK